MQEHSRHTLEFPLASKPAGDGEDEGAPQAEPGPTDPQGLQILGRLTGAVAHDFNNLLGAISNHLYLIERQANSPAQTLSIAAIRRSVDKGSRLTQHLQRLAGNAALPCTSLDLARGLPQMAEVLCGLLGRGIECSVHIEPGTAHVQVDPGELELALVKLALDATDAMPSGSKLRLAARNARPEESRGLPGATQQDFVHITFSDLGLGTGVSWCLPATATAAGPARPG